MYQHINRDHHVTIYQQNPCFIHCVRFSYPQVQHEVSLILVKYKTWSWMKGVISNYLRTQNIENHDVHFSCAITQPLLAHHWRVHQCLLTPRFIAPLIPWGVSSPGGKMRKQLVKDHNFLNNSPIFIIGSSTFNIFAFQKALHTIPFNLKNRFRLDERYLTP